MDAIQKILDILKERGMTQAQLSNESGLAKGTINRILKRHQELMPNTLCKIAEALSVSIYELEESYDDTDTRFNVSGYIDYCGDIFKIKSLKDLKNHVEKIERVLSFFKFKEKKLPKQKAISISDIDYYRWETIDATQIEVKSFKSGSDIVDGEKFDIGNMCSGYPFVLNGETFNNSESAYIAGLFSKKTPLHIKIQHQLQENNDGYAAKKQIRMRNQNVARSKEDWESFNVEWMKYVVWQKCKTNIDFANTLKKIPETAMVIENSTGMTSETAQFWGAFNRQLSELRDAKEKKYLMENPKATKEAINIERNSWRNYGLWEGTNCMGKILKACSLCLIHDKELPIDYDILNRANIYLMGKKLIF